MARSNQTTKSPRAGAEDAPQGGDALEQQVVAFAEQLGRIVGTVQAKADGWLDQTALRDQVTKVRDGAASLLQHLGATTGHKTEHTASGGEERAAIARVNRGTRGGGRSGGVVDAPGKKHRKPVANTPVRASAADAARPMKNKRTSAAKRRGRG